MRVHAMIVATLTICVTERVGAGAVDDDIVEGDVHGIAQVAPKNARRGLGTVDRDVPEHDVPEVVVGRHRAACERILRPQQRAYV